MTTYTPDWDKIQAYLYAAGLPPGKYTRAELRNMATAAGLIRTKAGKVLPGRLMGEIPASPLIRARESTVYVRRAGGYKTVQGRVVGIGDPHVLIVHGR